MSIVYRPHQIEPVPPRFEEEFVRGGWRRVENIFNMRTTVVLRWLDQCDRVRLKALRDRYRRGDLSALDEVRGVSVASVVVSVEG